MRTKWFWNLLMMLVMALSMVGCGSDDDEKKDDEGGGEGGTTVTTQYTATTEVKEIKLTRTTTFPTSNYTIYMDFMHKYALDLHDGLLYLTPFYRKNGSWEYTYNRFTYIRDIGKLNAITDITEKVELQFDTVNITAKPQHGYAMAFKTENDEWKYLRVYIKGYTLDDKEALSSITVQYQLY